jgi:hypothetical protein
MVETAEAGEDFVADETDAAAENAKPADAGFGVATKASFGESGSAPTSWAVAAGAHSTALKASPAITSRRPMFSPPICRTMFFDRVDVNHGGWRDGRLLIRVPGVGADVGRPEGRNPSGIQSYGVWR